MDNPDSYYWSIRLTVPWNKEGEQMSRRAQTKQYLKYIFNYVDPTYSACCWEDIDKYGKKTKEHFHLNFITQKEIKKDTLQKWIRKNILEDLYDNPHTADSYKGKAYAISMHGDVRDEHDWWQYIFKQEPLNIIDKMTTLPPVYEKERDAMIMAAQSQRRKTININNKVAEAKDIKNTFRYKLFQKLKKQNVKTERDFVIGAIKIFNESAKLTPYSKLKDYWIDYQINTKMMTPEQFYDNIFSKKTT